MESRHLRYFVVVAEAESLTLDENATGHYPVIIDSSSELRGARAYTKEDYMAPAESIGSN